MVMASVCTLLLGVILVLANQSVGLPIAPREDWDIAECDSMIW